jgi:putative membrane protein
MLNDALLAYAHYASILALAGLLAAELALCTRDGAAARLQRLKTIDGLYGLSAMLVLGTGAARVWMGAKGSAFYLGNPVFYAKLALFLAVGLVSAYPTIQFFRWAAAFDANRQFSPGPDAIARVRKLLKLQLLGVACLPLLAALMARGVGH